MKSIHEQIFETLNLKVGDTVKVTHKVPDHNLGWDNDWNPLMDSAIGNEYIVKGFGTKPDKGVELGWRYGYYFPAQCLEVVKRAPEYIEVKLEGYVAKVYPGKKIVVGCQNVTKEQFEEIQKAFNNK